MLLFQVEIEALRIAEPVSSGVILTDGRDDLLQGHRCAPAGRPLGSIKLVHISRLTIIPSTMSTIWFRASSSPTFWRAANSATQRSKCLGLIRRQVPTKPRLNSRPSRLDALRVNIDPLQVLPGQVLDPIMRLVAQVRGTPFASLVGLKPTDPLGS